MLSIHDTGASPPCPAPFNLAAHVLTAAERVPEKLALSVIGPEGTEDWSYGALRAAVLGTGAGLLEHGARPGDRVLLRLGNTAQFPIAYLGAIAVGLTPVPTSTQLTEPEVDKIIAHLEPALILRNADVACPKTRTPVIGADALREMWSGPPAEWEMGDPARPAYIVYTSGTSGAPRAVVHAHRAIWARRMMVKGWTGLREDDRLLHAGAFNWTFTLGTGLMDPWSVGATALIPAPGTEPAQLPDLLRRHEATIFAAAPGVYRKLLKSGRALDLPRMRHGLSAGEKMPDSIRAAWEGATGTPVHEAYGLSECSTFLSSSPARTAPPGTLGYPQPGRRVALLGPEGPVPRGQPGVIAVHRGDPGLMLGYHDAPEATARRMQGDWFCTGDLGQMEADGAITYLGRDDDMMNAGGLRVSPLEVEAVLATCPGITACAVTDIEVRADVRVIMAFYTAPAPVDAGTLDRHMNGALAAYKRPRGYVHVDALPTGANGKLQRRALAQLYEAPNGET
ncbi:long-chain fatty acid--CoA ligase [Roseovarius spongiae]|uniref:Long-chain fatty acid--CoA ligase n=1 Tax=Roseovarius spongiae TaxID=2320272 RepID=A0A3A8AXI9_9RHOB|nr:class I adenylate-forming enzyme family protein [Roseovarius spongiae]RKF17153.1 long-chain fatty acid--CoA ligase [Roseovarius spongiae]